MATLALFLLELVLAESTARYFGISVRDDANTLRYLCVSSESCPEQCGSAHSKLPEHQCVGWFTAGKGQDQCLWRGDEDNLSQVMN